MAWQLIYTSAPRLLEAGRTGFGTVARHRAVSGMLVSSVERFSQFARLPGHDPRRIVHTYRILTVGSGTYHVFSCLQDAGSDYTGRTNHIAHHVIAEAREIRAAAAAGLTPADVLLAFPWRASWAGAPSFLDLSDEIDLASLRVGASQAWTSLTGNSASARLLATPQALKGCYVVLTPALKPLELFRESMLEAPLTGWQTSFTTNIEPNDDVGGFRWIGIPLDSPLRGQMETSSRMVFDLARPGSLPPPPEIQVVAPPSAEPLPASTPEPSSIAASPTKERLNRPPTRQPAPLATTMGGWSPEPTRSGASKGSHKWLGISLAVAALLTVSALGFMLWQQSSADKAREALIEKIASVWKQQHIIGMENTKAWLEKMPRTEDAQALLKSHETFFKQVQLFIKKPVETSPPSQPEKTQDETQTLGKHLQNWQSLHTTKLPKPTEASGSFAESDTSLRKYQQWLRQRNDCWEELENDLQLEKSPPPPDAGILKRLAATAKDALKNRRPETDTPDDWQKLFDAINTVVPEVKALLDQWRKIEGDKSGNAAMAAATNPDLPPWLREEAQKIKKKADEFELAQRMAEQKQKAEEEDRTKKAQLTNIEDADALTAKNPLIICLLKAGDDPRARLKSILKPYVAADMQIYYGQPWDKHPIPDATNPSPGGLQKWTVRNGVYRETLMSKEKMEITPAGEITELPPGAAANGARIVARRKDGVKVLFDLRLIPPGKTHPPVLTEEIIPATAVNATSVTLTLKEDYLARLTIVGMTKPQYLLRSGAGVAGAAAQIIYELVGDKASFVVKQPQSEAVKGPTTVQLKITIDNLNSDIQKDDKALAELENKNEAKTQKDEKRTRITTSKAEKEKNLNTAQAELTKLQNYVPPLFTLKSGDYTLLEKESGNTEVCRLHVTATTEVVKPAKPAAAPTVTPAPTAKP